MQNIQNCALLQPTIQTAYTPLKTIQVLQPVQVWGKLHSTNRYLQFNYATTKIASPLHVHHTVQSSLPVIQSILLRPLPVAITICQTNYIPQKPYFNWHTQQSSLLHLLFLNGTVHTTVAIHSLTSSIRVPRLASTHGDKGYGGGTSWVRIHK